MTSDAELIGALEALELGLSELTDASSANKAVLAQIAAALATPAPAAQVHVPPAAVNVMPATQTWKKLRVRVERDRLTSTPTAYILERLE